ncbi:hypothetical protein ACH492_34395 [Streptomyces sp. NPDC019443]|uniref:hypothetical protein n=1 Tax=Streptomyces sp. NPDC019443 TaxID=3365061 RepID=UPI0037AB72A0
MAEEAPVVIHAVSSDGGRVVTVRGERVGVAYHLLDVLEFLRRAGLPETDTVVDDPELIEWRGGGPDVWSDRPQRHDR